MTPPLRPDVAFAAYLDALIQKSWIKRYSWSPVRRTGLDAAFSKTHKTDDAGTAWQIEIESCQGGRSGIDLEYFDEGRPLFQNKDWLERRLKIPAATIRSLSASELLEEWSYREAAFKALYPHNHGVVLSDFQRPSRTEMRFQRDEEEYHFTLSGEWQGPWFMAVVLRNS
ncbi:MAG: hypothetical protein ABIR96_08625 [Bdellovibrionota bacterium]